MRKSIAFASLVLLFGIIPAFAGEHIEPDWGIASTSFKTIDNSDFISAGGAPVLNGTRGRLCVQGFGVCKIIAPIDLPSGAQITGYSAEACHMDANAGIRYVIHKKSLVTAEDVLIGPMGDSTALGCFRFGTNLTTPYTVDNLAYSLYAEVQMDAPANQPDSEFGSFRVFYKLQVSPAPGTATFSDVPTNHLFFQYIEALAASGITSGCTAPPNPNFCPDAPLTRGQMAVFLSRALGLHFPN